MILPINYPYYAAPLCFNGAVLKFGDGKIFRGKFSRLCYNVL